MVSLHCKAYPRLKNTLKRLSITFSDLNKMDISAVSSLNIVHVFGQKTRMTYIYIHLLNQTVETPVRLVLDGTWFAFD